MHLVGGISNNQLPNHVEVTTAQPCSLSLWLNPSIVLCAFVCHSTWLTIPLIWPHTFLLSVTPSATLGKLLQRWQMASRVTFGDIQGSAFISVLQFTLVNEIHLCCQDGLLPPPSLSGCPVYREMARWRAALWLLSNVMLKKKIFNGLSVAFPALTCQVIRNISRSHTHSLSVFLVKHLFFIPLLPRAITPC